MSEPVLRIQSALTGRDLILLGWLADHGLLTSFHIADALYPSLNFAQRRLRKLIALGVVDRFRPQRADGGSYPYHYVLSQLGVEVVTAQRGQPLPRRDVARHRRWQLTNRANLPHLLGVNEFFIQLAAYARTHPDAALRRWWPAAQCQRAGAFLAPGEDNLQALVYQPRIRPDGHGIFAEGLHESAFFLEYDTGTEPLTRLNDKVTGYRDLALVTGNVWPVLFWLHSAERERHFHRSLAETAGEYPVATAVHGLPTTSAHPRGSSTECPAEAVWWLHGRREGLLRLAQLPSTPRYDI